MPIKLSKNERRQQGITEMSQASTTMNHSTLLRSEGLVIPDNLLNPCTLVIGIFSENKTLDDIRHLCNIANFLSNENTHMYLKLNVYQIIHIVPHLINWKISNNLLSIIHSTSRISEYPGFEPERVSYSLLYARKSNNKRLNNNSMTNLISLNSNKDFSRLFSNLILRSGETNNYLLNLDEGMRECILSANQARMNSISVINEAKEIEEHRKVLNLLELTNKG